jgi:hypothetical protein
MSEHAMLAGTIASVAKAYGLNPKALYRAIKSGELEAPRRVGRRSIISTASVNKWLASLPPTKTSRPKKQTHLPIFGAEHGSY